MNENDGFSRNIECDELAAEETERVSKPSRDTKVAGIIGWYYNSRTSSIMTRWWPCMHTICAWHFGHVAELSEHVASFAECTKGAKLENSRYTNPNNYLDNELNSNTNSDGTPNSKPLMLTGACEKVRMAQRVEPCTYEWKKNQITRITTLKKSWGKEKKRLRPLTSR